MSSSLTAATEHQECCKCCRYKPEVSLRLLTFHLPVLAQVPDWCEQEWRLAMEACWEVNPDHRPSLRDLARRLELIMEHAAD